MVEVIRVVEVDRMAEVIRVVGSKKSNKPKILKFDPYVPRFGPWISRSSPESLSLVLGTLALIPGPKVWSLDP